MKRFAFLFLLPLFLGSSLKAVTPVYAPQSACVVASTHNIPTAYSLSDVGSLILSVASQTAVTHFAVTTNTLAAATAVSLSTNTSQGAPSSSSTNQLFLDSNLTPALDGIRISNAILIRSTTGSALTTGTICVLVW